MTHRTETEEFQQVCYHEIAKTKTLLFRCSKAQKQQLFVV